MKHFFVLVFGCLLSLHVFCQDKFREEVSFSFQKKGLNTTSSPSLLSHNSYTSRNIPIPALRKSPFITLAPRIIWNELDHFPKIRVHLFDIDGTKQETLEVLAFSEGVVVAGIWQGDLMFISSNTHTFSFEIQFEENSKASIEEVVWGIYAPGFSKQLLKRQSKLEHASHPFNCQLPGFVDREGWNSPDGNDPSCSPAVETEVTHLIVHHSAGPNESDDWGAVVRAFWNLHVNSNGWCDIGYNWLIDPNGVIYQGRGGTGDIRGAHFCGKNTGTMGVCLIGNFNTSQPSQAAIAALDSLLAWKSFQLNLDPSGMGLHASSEKDLFHISGHRDGCNTSCPGENLYPLLSNIRARVDSLRASCSNMVDVDVQLFAGLKIFPNPSLGEIHIETERLSQEISYELTDNVGRSIRKGKLHPHSSIFSLNLSKLPKGLYTVVLSSSQTKLRKKILLQ